MDPKKANESLPHPLLQEYLSYIAVDKGLRAKSQEAYKGDLEDYLAFLVKKGRAPDDPTVGRPLTLFVIHLHDQGLSPRSIARKISAIRGFYRFLIREGKMSEDPSRLLERPKTGQPLPKVLSIEQVEQILAKPDTTNPLGLRDRALLEVLYATGIRETELIDLHLENINREGEFLFVRGKGGRERVVPIGRYAMEAVERYLLLGRSRLLKDISERSLFLNPYGRALSRMGVWKIVRKYALAAGIGTAVSPHVFRHSCATHMLEGGANILIVQEMLGHVDIATTQIYTHLSRQDLIRIHRESHPRSRGPEKGERQPP